MSSTFLFTKRGHGLAHRLSTTGINLFQAFTKEFQGIPMI